MNDVEIRDRLRVALGDAVYPPDLTSRTRARLNESSPVQGNAWALAVVAALLAIALVVTIVLGSNALHKRASIPVVPPPTKAPGSPTCPNYTQLSQQLSSVNMVTASVGWAAGGLRTTDGGADWRDMSPGQLRDGMSAPAVANRLYPPGFKDFYLDATHGWEFRTYASSTTCADHSAVFVTSDGGRTWKTSASITLHVPAGDAALAQLDFLDPQHGWLWVTSGRQQDVINPTRGTVYSTSDGGFSWRQVSVVGPPTPCSSLFSIVFANSTDGWISLGCSNSLPMVLQTLDAGATWKLQKLPAYDCPCSVGDVTFTDPVHGTATIYANSTGSVPGGPLLDSTIDAGRTWREVPATPTTGYSIRYYFLDADTWLDFVTQPGWTKLQPTHAWIYRTTNAGQTWTLIAQDTPIARGLVGVFFTDLDHGIVIQIAETANSAGSSGYELMATSDGGLTWTATPAQVGG